MKKRLSFAIIWFLVMSLTGCGLGPGRGARQDNLILNTKRVDLADTRSVKEKMYQQYRAWKGTKYSFGGLSRRGIDCSGFVSTTYLEKFGIELPRSTKLMSRIGRKIRRSDLRSGDLVFFKTGFKARHVGIYIEKDQFIHVSTKKGVTISKLTDHYWKERYWHSRRVAI